MRLMLKTVFTLITAIFAIVCLPSFAHAKEMTAEQLRADFARYVSVGRGNTEIHVTMKGQEGSTSTRETGNGVYTCRISGLDIVERVDGSDVLLEMKGKFIHEYTHCLVAPYFNAPFEKPKNITEAVAYDIVQLTEEGISDARALIELYRHDGALVAEEYAQFMIAMRVDAEKIFHKTAQAITCARDVISREPEQVASDERAFALALSCGKSGAWKTLRDLLTTNGHGEIMESDVLKNIKSAVDASELRARSAFTSGRYLNNAITIHLGHEDYTRGDHHVFIRSDGSVETVDALGSESAEGIRELQLLIVSSAQSEHLLAVTALRKHGRLSVRNLRIMSGHFSNFVHVVMRKMPEPEHRARALRIIEEVITESQIGEGIDPIFNEASRRIQREFKI